MTRNPKKYLLQHCDGENNWQQHKNGEAETIEGNDEIKVDNRGGREIDVRLFLKKEKKKKDDLRT